MNVTIPDAHQARQQRGQQTFRPGLRRGLALTSAIGVALLMVGLVLAMDNFQTFHATGEQVNQGVGVGGGYTDTLAADGAYRLIREEYASSQARTLGDNPSSFSYFTTYTDVVNFTPYTMPVEGGLIYRIGIYVFEVGSGDTEFRVALYEDTESVPRLLLAQSEPLTATSTGWLWFDVEPRSIPGNTRYWLAYQATDRDASLGWRNAPPYQGYYFRVWDWGPFPALAGTTWGPVYRRTCYQIAYTATHYALDVEYTIPVTHTLDAYTLTVQGATSGESFTITADGQAVGAISYNPTTQHFFSDDMESGVDGWVADGFIHIITDSSHYSSPTHAWWTDDVPYSSAVSLTSASIALPSNARDVELRFWQRMVSQSTWDGGWLEYRIQNEDETWPTWSELTTAMFLQGSYNSLLEHVPSGIHWGWSGTISDVVRVQVPVTAAGRSIQWRWLFECDPAGGEGPNQPDGWWIDDVRVLGTTLDDTTLAFPLPLSAASDGQVTVRFQDTITNSYPDLLSIDLIEITGLLRDGPITVTATMPSGGEYWSGTRTVEWSGSDINGDVITYNVYLSTDGGDTWSPSLHEVSYSETETPATHVWDGLDTTAFSDSQDSLVRIEASDGVVNARDQSDAAFTIDNTPPSVTLAAPNGGEMLQGGASYPITWSGSDDNFGSLPIALYYSTDGGVSFSHTITSATENDGAFTWAVPELDNATVQVRVVATDLAGNSNHDDSDDNFTVDSTPPTVTLAAPNGGELLLGGTSYPITWSGSDDNFGSLPIALYYSTDGGVSFSHTITSATENDGAFTWAVPELDNATVQVRVVATDLAGNSNHDDSDDNFTVDSTHPNGTVAIAEGDYTNSRDVHLTLDAPVDTTGMYLDGDLTDASNVRQWTAYTTATTVTLTAGEGSKTATVRYRDSAGHEGDLASDTVIYDATAPMIEDESPGDGSTITTGTPVISATLTDGMSGIDSTTIAMTVDGSLVVHAYDPGSGTVSYTPSPALTNASHVVAISVQDRAGNPVSGTWDFSVNEPPASALLTANPTSILPDGISTATVTATVRSRSGHFVTDGTQVVFTTTMGTLAGGPVYTTTTHEGVATAVLTAPTTEGKAIITARAGDAEGMTEVLLTFQPYHVYLPLVINVYLP